MRPILALNCLLQIEQERSEEESSVGDVLALTFRCARLCLLCKLCTLVRPCNILTLYLQIIKKM